MAPSRKHNHGFCAVRAPSTNTIMVSAPFGPPQRHAIVVPVPCGSPSSVPKGTRSRFRPGLAALAAVVGEELAGLAAPERDRGGEADDPDDHRGDPHGGVVVGAEQDG